MPGRTWALLEEVTEAAFKRQCVARPSLGPEQHQHWPLVPLIVEIARDGQEPICEHILWRLGDPHWEPATVAAQLCADLHLPITIEQQIVEQIEEGLRSYLGWRDLGGERRVMFQVFARLGDKVVLDSVEWDVNQPANTPEQYASFVCSQLSLGVAWWDIISAHVQRLVDDTREDLQTMATAIEAAVLPVMTSGRRDVPLDPGDPAAGPRLEAYDPLQDVEAQRQRRRSERREMLMQQLADERREAEAQREAGQRAASEAAQALQCSKEEERKRAAGQASAEREGAAEQAQHEHQHAKGEAEALQDAADEKRRAHAAFALAEQADIAGEARGTAVNEPHTTTAEEDAAAAAAEAAFSADWHEGQQQ